MASIVSSIIEKLKDPLLEEVSFLYSVSGKVGSVRQKLEWIKPFLEDAEARSNESKVIQHWVTEVKEVAYRIEDAIDIYVVEIQGERMLGSDLIACIKWVYEGLIMKLVALHNLGVELDNIETTLQKIDENKNLFNINDLGENSRARAELTERQPSLEYIDDESKIVGLEAHKIVLKKLLKPQNPDLSVISIVGTGGLGKTTLAQKVFNSAVVKQKFNARIWLSVSHEFNRVQILKKMLEDIREVKQEERDRDEVYFIKEIRKSLEEKNIFIVLDDVWSETLWPDHIRLACPPASDKNEGRVLITTRDRNVAEKAEGELFELQFLSTEESKMLLYKIAFPKETPPGGLDSLATELARKCGYLPLALVVVGGRLRRKKLCSEWRKVADSINWQGSNKCTQILAASYDDMSIVLKTCFMYLASFPEDYEIDAKSLVLTWVAEDLVPDEVTAVNCLEELVQRCMIIAGQRSYDGSLEKFCIHDLLRELAIREAKEKKFLSVFIKETPDRSFDIARRTSLQSCTFGDRNSTNFDSERKVKRKYNKRLRSLMVFSKCLPGDLSGFQLLKVLKIHGCFISFRKFEKWFEELIHLRHLEFRDCTVESGNYMIPQSIGHLKNLLTLDCTGTCVEELPESLWSITTLRHVFLTDFYLPKSPLPSANLSNLRTLHSVMLQPQSPGLDALRNFSNLHELGLLNSDPWVAPLLKELNQLVSLQIGERLLPLPLDILDMRVFPFYQSLQYLNLDCKWPKHVELRAYLFPPRLTKLCIWRCDFKKDPMPELEQLQNLEILMLKNGEHCSTMTMNCSTGGFPQLQKLRLGHFQATKEFNITPGAMPMLKRLSLDSFMGMKNIPELQHLKMLQEFQWTDVPYSEEGLQAMRDENQHKLQHIPSVVLSTTSVHSKIRIALTIQHSAFQFMNALAVN